MTNEELKTYLFAMQPSLTFDESGEWLNIMTDAADWKHLAARLRGEPLQFDYLFCVTCVDWKTHFTIVYHFSSTVSRHTIVVKAKADRNEPQIETVCDIWRSAEFLEREVYDLFGIEFLHHPDLRRLILEDDRVGYPLRKDYEDPVNMIKL